MVRCFYFFFISLFLCFFFFLFGPISLFRSRSFSFPASFAVLSNNIPLFHQVSTSTSMLLCKQLFSFIVAAAAAADVAGCCYFFGLYLRSDKEPEHSIIRLNETKSQFPWLMSFHYVSPHSTNAAHHHHRRCWHRAAIIPRENLTRTIWCALTHIKSRGLATTKWMNERKRKGKNKLPTRKRESKKWVSELSEMWQTS